jgi:hypothetical protein
MPFKMFRVGLSLPPIGSPNHPDAMVDAVLNKLFRREVLRVSREIQQFADVGGQHQKRNGLVNTQIRNAIADLVLNHAPVLRQPHV